MRIELDEEATRNALAAAGATGKTANELTNILWKNITAIEISQVVEVQTKSKKKFIRKITSSKYLNQF